MPNMMGCDLVLYSYKIVYSVHTKSDEFSMIICDTLSAQIEFNFFGMSSPIDPARRM